MAPDPNRVLIFDTTLRDGEQSPGCSMTQPEKLRVATRAGRARRRRHRGRLPGRLARRLRGRAGRGARGARARSSAAWRAATRDDIELAARALKDAPTHRRIHVFLATSAIHRQYKLNMAQDEILRRAVEGVRIARELCDDVEFSPEDASRTELEFLARGGRGRDRRRRHHDQHPRHRRLHRAATSSRELFRYLRKNVRGIEQRAAVGALPRRPRHGRRQQPDRGASPARARSSARSTASASAPATARSRKW